MKAKDFIIIGSAIALYYLYQKNKNKTLSTFTSEDNVQEEATPSVGGGGGGTMPTGGSLTPLPPKQLILTPVNPTVGTSSGEQAIFTGNTPINIVSGTEPSPIKDITNPISTAPVPAYIPPPIKDITNPISTAPVPAYVLQPIKTAEQVLISDGITPIVKPTLNLRY